MTVIPGHAKHEPGIHLAENAVRDGFSGQIDIVNLPAVRGFAAPRNDNIHVVGLPAPYFFARLVFFAVLLATFLALFFTVFFVVFLALAFFAAFAAFFAAFFAFLAAFFSR
jgi:hypothetical protein